MNSRQPTAHNRVVSRLRAEGRTTPDQARAQLARIFIRKLPYHVAMPTFFVGVSFAIGRIDNDFVAIVGILAIFLALGAYLKKLDRLDSLRPPLTYCADSHSLRGQLQAVPALWDLFVEWRVEARGDPQSQPLLLDQQRLIRARDEILGR